MPTRGISFPFTYKTTGSGVISVSSAKPNFVKIVQSIEIILLTEQGTRFFMPQFGSRLHLLLFEMNEELTEDLAKIIVREAIETWEDRVELLRVDIANDDEYTDQGIFVVRPNLLIIEDRSVGSFDYAIKTG